MKREEGKMEVHIACINRPGLLVDIMGALDSRRITVLHARIACRQNVLFEALTLEVRFADLVSDLMHVMRSAECKKFSSSHQQSEIQPHPLYFSVAETLLGATLAKCPANI